MNDSPVSVERVEELHPLGISIFKSFIERCEAGIPGLVLRITNGLRTFAVQAADYAQGRTTPGPVITDAKPGLSFHQYGLAIDVVQMINGVPNWKFDFSQLVPFMPEGMVWGGHFPGSCFVDKPHFEYGFGLTVYQCLAKYNAKDFIPGTQFINIP